MFGGFFVLFFRKRIRNKRIREFYHYANERKNSWIEFGIINGIPITIPELERLGRQLKLQDLNRKIKIKKIKKWVRLSQ
jgi:hypothetical protein